MKKVLYIILVVVLIGILGVFIVQNSKNTAIRLEEQVMTSKKDISVQEKRRADLIPNLVEFVKEYDKHEYELLSSLIEKRGSEGVDVKEVTTIVNAVAEAYPELKSSENYRQLMTELAITENSISSYRENYNRSVREYNSHVRSFPNTMFLDILGYQKLTFEALEYEGYEDAPTNLF